MKLSNALKCGIAIFVSELSGIIGSIATAGSVTSWYPNITKPEFTPPSWVFGPVWTVLYALMGIAAFLIWRKGWKQRGVKTALALFVGQLILNTLWSIIFFGLHSLGGALIEILLLWVAIFAMILAFAKISKWAAWLLVPYLLWVSFATYLTYSFYVLNAGA